MRAYQYLDISRPEKQSPMQRLEVRALLSPLMGFLADAAPAAAPGDITVDEELEEDAFLRALEEQLQQRMGELGASDAADATAAAHPPTFLALRVSQVDTLARRLRDALEPKRDAETGLVQAWTIQPQLQLQRKVKLSSHLQVLKLSTILREVRRLRLHQAGAGAQDADRAAPIELDIFPSLRVVEILHSQAALLRNVHCFARQLQSMHIEHTPMRSLRELLAPSPPLPEDAAQGAAWRRLERLELNCCDLPEVDASANLLTAVKVLDLGWNEIKSFGCPLAVPTLESLSLCHNLLPSIPPIQALKWLRALDLSVNQIHSLLGLEALQMLETLDVSHNLIGAIAEVERLVELPSLRRLKLSHNPIARRADYRREVFFFLGSSLELDGQPWTLGEVESMKVCRSLRLSETSLTALADQETAEDTMKVFPKAGGLAIAFGSASRKLVMDYPTLPAVHTITPQFVAIQNPPQSSLLRQYIRQQVAGSGFSEDGRAESVSGSSIRRDDPAQSSGSEALDKLSAGVGSLAFREGIRTVDDYFRVKSDSIVVASVPDENDPDFSTGADASW